MFKGFHCVKLNFPTTVLRIGTLVIRRRDDMLQATYRRTYDVLLVRAEVSTQVGCLLLLYPEPGLMPTHMFLKIKKYLG